MSWLPLSRGEGGGLVSDRVTLSHPFGGIKAGLREFGVTGRGVVPTPRRSLAGWAPAPALRTVEAPAGFDAEPPPPRSQRVPARSAWPRPPFLPRAATWCHDHRRRVLLAWLLALVASIAVSGAIGGSFDDASRLPGTDSQRAYDVLAAEFPQARRGHRHRGGHL